MSSVKAMAVLRSRPSRASLGLAVGFAVLVFSPPAHADGNACADAYSRAQELRTKRKLIGAREALRICSQTTCPAFIVKDCTTWLDEVQSSLPSVVPPSPRMARGTISARRVRVSMDGQVLLENSGRALGQKSIPDSTRSPSRSRARRPSRHPRR